MRVSQWRFYHVHNWLLHKANKDRVGRAKTISALIQKPREITHKDYKNSNKIANKLAPKIAAALFCRAEIRLFLDLNLFAVGYFTRTSPGFGSFLVFKQKELADFFKAVIEKYSRSE